MHVLITGATGIVGKALVDLLENDGYSVRITSRERNVNNTKMLPSAKNSVYFDLDVTDNDYRQLLKGIDVVVHLAARVHKVSKDKEDDEMYRVTNILGTENLIKESAKLGVKRFIYLSSVKASGEVNIVNENKVCKPFVEGDKPCPDDSYGKSKLEAEKIIANICSGSDIEFVILRSPLIYGPGVKANFLSLLKIVNRNIPLPLKSLKNKRSMLYVGNLVDAIAICLNHPGVSNKTYFVSDVDITIPRLISKLAFFMERKTLIFPFPAMLLKVIGIVLGKRSIVERITGSLVVDNSLFRRDTGWAPPYSLDEGLSKTTKWYLTEQNNL